MAVFAEVRAQGTVTVAHYSFRSRVDFLLQTRLLPLTWGLVDAVDAALRRAYKLTHGKDLLDPEGSSRSSRTRPSPAT